MKLGILSRATRSYSTQRLRAAAVERGIDVTVYDTLRFAIDLSRDEPNVSYYGRDVHDIDAILPRIGASITFYGLAVVRQFQAMDVYTPNTADGIANSRDKLRAMQILSRHEIDIPATTFARERGDIQPAIARVGGAPVIIKTLEGTQGIGVILAPDLPVQSLLIGFDGQQEVGPLLQAPAKNACVVCSASAWIKAPLRSSVLSSSLSAAFSLESWVS